MCKAPSRQPFQRARNPLLGNALVPRVLMIAVPFEPDLFEIILESRRAHEIPDLPAQYREFVGIKHFSAIVFLDQVRKRRQRTARIRMRQRRHEMIHDDGVRAALGLCTFAGIIHHERIDERQIGEEHVRRAIGGHRKALAGQPLERAVRAEVNDRIGSPLIGNPPIERCVVMARR